MLDAGATTSSSSAYISQKFQVENANRSQLSFTAKVFGDDSFEREVETTINGYTDLIVSVGQNNSWAWDSVRFLIELKSPPAFAKNSDFEGPKNQIFAELLGFKTMLDDNNSKNRNNKVIKGCLTDGFAIYICFLHKDMYYISHHTVEPVDYINALLFLLCDVNTSELDKLIQNSEVTLDKEVSSGCSKSSNNKKNPYDRNSKANKNNKDNNNKTKTNHTNNDGKSSKRPMRVINFKYEDEMEQYQNKLDYITRLENGIWGYAHIDKENLQNCVPDNHQTPSDYVMSKFLSDT